MDDGWAETSLGNICKFTSGNGFSKDRQGNSFGEVPFIKVSDMNLPGNEISISVANNWITRLEADTEYSVHPAGAVAFAKIGIALTTNRRRYITRPTVLDNNMMSATPKESVDGRWFFSLLRILDFNDISRGSALPYLAVSDLKNIPVPLPPSAEQRAIGALLGALDDKIELNRRMNETLEAMAQTIFRDWFVDFGPVRRKLAGTTDPVEIMGGLTPDPARAAALAALFPAKFEGELPSGWEVKPFGQLLLSSVGGDWGLDTPNAETDQPVCIIRGTDLQALRQGGKGKVPTRFTTSKKRASRILEPGDIVLEVSGGSPTQPTGRSLRITPDILDRFAIPVVCATFCRRLRPRSKAEGLIAFNHLRDLYASGGTWEYQNQSTGIANFQTTQFLKSEHVVWPSSAVAEAFSDLVSPMTLLGSNNQIAALEELRDYLLPRLMSGAVRVGDVTPQDAAA